MRGRLSRQRVWRAARIAGVILFAVLFVPVIIALIGVGVQCRVWGGAPPNPDVATAPPGQRPEVQAITAQLSDYRRNEDQTYLTLPEWYIVYSADEYAAFVADHAPSSFPFFGATRQFWGSYYDVCAVTRRQYPFNSGYHLSLVVIGTSFTIENTLRGLYENTIGRVTEWLSDGGQSEEDAYARRVAREYGTFLHTIPWYEFPFGARLRGLWTETGLWGRYPIRKWERKLALSVEYGSKAAYGWLIKQGTQSVYSTEELQIQLWATSISPEIIQDEPRVRVVEELGQQGAIVALPRYEPFSRIVPGLVARGVEFVEIAGNDEILVTVLAPRTWDYGLDDGELLFSMPILTQPGRKRSAINVPVAALHRVLGEIERGTVELEHIYDY